MGGSLLALELEPEPERELELEPNHMIIPDEGFAPAPKPEPTKSRKGFAAMDDATKRDLASRGGRAAHAAGTAHEWTVESAKAAGHKGGLQSSSDRAAMAERGRKGGKARAAAIAARNAGKP